MIVNTAAVVPAFLHLLPLSGIVTAVALSPLLSTTIRSLSAVASAVAVESVLETDPLEQPHYQHPLALTSAAGTVHPVGIIILIDPPCMFVVAV